MNRYYDPGIGRYLQPEPMLADVNYALALAKTARPVLPYGYAFDNPVCFFDSSGLGPGDAGLPDDAGRAPDGKTTKEALEALRVECENLSKDKGVFALEWNKCCKTAAHDWYSCAIRAIQDITEYSKCKGRFESQIVACDAMLPRKKCEQ